MALSQKALQRKREQRKKKKQPQLKTGPSTELTYQQWPIDACLVPDDLWDKGLGQVVVARHNQQGTLAVGMYLLDVFCLGVKDCFVRLTDRASYEAMLAHMTETCEGFSPADPRYAKALIYQAAAYAKSLGFKPPADFAKAQKLLIGLAMDENQVFVFGRGGKPCYMQGPNESPADVRRILATLATTQGHGNYDFLLEVPDPILA